MTYEQRQAMIGKRYSKNNFTGSVTVRDVERCAGGFTVKYTTPDSNNLLYMGLKKFIKQFPHEA
ncbi:TPA: hypothetical protein ACIBVD_001768 [Salmonella enterica subsp. enterica serovar Javiana]